MKTSGHLRKMVTSLESPIQYQLPQAGHVELVVYNILGQPVSKLMDEVQPAGSYQVFWDGTDDASKPVGSGVFFYRLSAKSRVQTRRVILLK